MNAIPVFFIIYINYAICLDGKNDTVKLLDKAFPKKTKSDIVDKSLYIINSKNVVKQNPVMFKIKTKEPNPLNRGYTFFPPLSGNEKRYNMPNSPYFPIEELTDVKPRVKKVLTNRRRKRSAEKNPTEESEKVTVAGTELVTGAETVAEIAAETTTETATETAAETVAETAAQTARETETETVAVSETIAVSEVPTAKSVVEFLSTPTTVNSSVSNLNTSFSVIDPGQYLRSGIVKVVNKQKTTKKSKQTPKKSKPTTHKSKLRKLKATKTMTEKPTRTTTVKSKKLTKKKAKAKSKVVKGTKKTTTKKDSPEEDAEDEEVVEEAVEEEVEEVTTKKVTTKKGTAKKGTTKKGAAKKGATKKDTKIVREGKTIKKKGKKPQKPGKSKKVRRTRRLVAANDALIEDYPYTVSIQKSGQHWCSGALLNPRIVITTANCIWKSSRVSRLRIRAGSRHADRGGQVTKIQEAIKHPKWSIRSKPDNDVALLLTDKIIRFSDHVHGVDLPNRAMLPPFDDAWVTSYGSDRRDGLFADPSIMNLQVYHARLMDREKCNNITSRYGVLVTNNFICLSQTGRRSPCTRDTGAPAVSDGVLWGIASWGIRKLCGTERFPAMFSYLASPSNMDFIMNATRILMADERSYPFLDKLPIMRMPVTSDIATVAL